MLRILLGQICGYRMRAIPELLLLLGHVRVCTGVNSFSVNSQIHGLQHAVCNTNT